ncbi:MAG: glycine cleavage system aminomethyltransferase GcvT [Endomicrobium sp.]|jgi:aminomethyltransferase|nr:glycine cleavage system aminomethyltransferase GcvT [Endomicrobium sp.]
MKRTYLYESHIKLGAKMTEFSGWEMSLQYSSIIEEHNAVRNNCGIFDTSHMGTFIISGKDSGDFLNRVTVSDMKNLPCGKAKYSMILNEDGGIKDDIVIYKFENEYMVVVNAGNAEKDFQWLDNLKSGDTELKNISAEICLLALQGQQSASIMRTLSETDTDSLKYFMCSPLKLKNINASFCAIARTGYTGEDGFEIFISKEQSKMLWDELIKLGVKPCGLGSRDTLRLESCMPLHGHEIDENINPIDAGFEKIIYWKNNFIGKDKLLVIKDKPSKKSVAFECDGGIARNGNKVFYVGEEVGYVTSGTFSPTLKKAIGLAFVDINIGSCEIEIEIRNNKRKAYIVNKPFYRRIK